MVIKHYISFIFLMITLGCLADDFHDGVNAFKKKDYDAAISFFNNEIEKKPTNVSAYFNIGLAYNAKKEYGKAIWAFERVLKLTPNNSEAIENIEQNYLELNNGEHWSPELTHFERTIYCWSSNSWAILSVALSLLIALFIILFRKTSTISKKRMFLAGGGITLILMLFSIYSASEADHYTNTHDHALVTKTEIETFKDENPASNSKTKSMLKAGTKVKRIEDYEGVKIKVETMNGDTYYLKADDVEFI